MTTYAWDGESLSADSRVTDPSSLRIYDNYYKKCCVAVDKKDRVYLVAGAGTPSVVNQVMIEVFNSEDPDWPYFSPEFIDKLDFNDNLSTTRITIFRCKEKDCMDYYRLTPELYIPPGHIHSAGTGDDIALGAMAAGMSSRKAVEIACKYNAATGGEIYTWATDIVKNYTRDEAIEVLRTHGLCIRENLL